MKRIYFCGAILLLILLLAVWGRQEVGGFQNSFSAQMDTLEHSISAGQWTQADTAANKSLASFRKQEHALSVFIRRDYLAALDVTLCAAQQYTAEQNIEEALAETARARSQCHAMCHLFFRML